MARRLVVTIVDDGTGDTRKLGEYYLPTSHCECTDVKRRQHVNNWGKARGSGIPICRVCRKPSPAWRRGLMARLEVALGRRIDIDPKG